MTHSRFAVIQIVPGLNSVYSLHSIINLATTLVSCNPMQPRETSIASIASITGTNYKSCIHVHCFHYPGPGIFSVMHIPAVLFTQWFSHLYYRSGLNLGHP